ncbi:nitrite/sulfite reductase [Clostridium algoriphilum]|uniref:nitrite/sulfite reductase n=1 Tax=Clostridium algoriphilum TaxID=198347 RepID=UPI001CF2C8F8|nr:nitrite/sulfite reductase [Clostridium algoriphilum]MCB2293575.1 nitrite/sulfite reductase [Clostridium algoriphilum]
MSYNLNVDRDKSKLNAIEIMKLEKDGLDVIETILDKYSNQGYDSITKDDMDRFKWAGVYQQRPKDGHFMLRVRNTGILTLEQVKTLAKISKDYGRGLINITTRGAIQFHWICVENLPDIFNRLKVVGLSSTEACGDCTRTIVGNPLAGIDKDELMDTTELINNLNEFFLFNRDFSNFPRKFKISISSNIFNAAHAEINDLAFTPAVKNINGEEKIGFHLWVGGGLSTTPHLAKRLNIFALPEDVLKVAIGVATIFRDYGYREKRNHARLKFLIEDWGEDKFQEKLLEIIGAMEGLGEDKLANWNAAYFYGVHKQKQLDKNYIGINVPFGELNADHFFELARISEKYGDSNLRTTLSQNLIISGVTNELVPSILNEPILKNFSPVPSPFIGHSVACTGKEFCNFAIVETKKIARDVCCYLDKKIELDTPIRIHFTGCPNACGQKQIGDINLQGALIKTSAGLVEAFDIFLGGTLGPNAKFSENLKCRVKSSDVAETLRSLILFFKNNRNIEETFNQFVNRVGVETFKENM